MYNRAFIVADIVPVPIHCTRYAVNLVGETSKALTAVAVFGTLRESVAAVRTQLVPSSDPNKRITPATVPEIFTTFTCTVPTSPPDTVRYCRFLVAVLVTVSVVVALDADFKSNLCAVAWMHASVRNKKINFFMISSFYNKNMKRWIFSKRKFIYLKVWIFSYGSLSLLLYLKQLDK
jgi:hypothetical protein